MHKQTHRRHVDKDLSLSDEVKAYRCVCVCAFVGSRYREKYTIVHAASRIDNIRPGTHTSNIRTHIHIQTDARAHTHAHMHTDALYINQIRFRTQFRWN